MEAAQLLTDFKSRFDDKYKLTSDTPLGDGAYGAVFQAVDLYRDVPVAIKIHHDGIAPQGAKRGYAISSIINNPHIATTYTVENYQSAEEEKCMAVVSQFVPGSSLRKVWSETEQLDDHTKAIIAEDYAFSLIPSLLEALAINHNLGYGHGDLHDGNIMVFISELMEKYHFHVVLIDFDNASIQGEVYCNIEQEKIDKDYRLLKRILENTLLDWEWFGLLAPLHDSYKRVELLQLAFTRVLDFITHAKKNILTTQSIKSYFVSLMNSPLGRGGVQPVVRATRLIAEKYDRSLEFQYAWEDFLEDLKKMDNWETNVEMEIIENAELKRKAYTKIFGG